MIPRIPVNKLIDSSALTAGIFITSGCYKTYKDFKTASHKYRNKFLIKDSVILSGAAAGMMAECTLGRKVSKSQVYKQSVRNFTHMVHNPKWPHALDTTHEIIKNIINGFLVTAFGVIGALGADYALSKTKFEQPKPLKKAPPKSKLHKYLDKNIAKVTTDENTRELIYTSVTDMPQMKFLTSGMVGTQAMEIAKDKEFDKRLRNTTQYLMNDTLVPLLFLSISSALTKKMHTLKRVPIIFGSIMGGTMITQKILDKFTNNSDDD